MKKSLEIQEIPFIYEVNDVSEEMKFFMYLLECYASYKNMSSAEVLKKWEEKGIIQKIYDNYWIYHTERIENAYMDIDSLIMTGQPAW